MSRILRNSVLLFAIQIVANTALVLDVCAQSPAEQEPARVRYGIRYTTGAVTTQGWEKTLTESNPNLGHWNWSAMTSYTQSVYKKVEPGAFLPKNQQPRTGPQAIHQTPIRQPGSVYVKPVHLAPEAFAPKREQSPQAIHVPLPQAEHRPLIIQERNKQTSSLQGRLLPVQNKPIQAERAKTTKPLTPVPVKTYNADYTLSGQLKPAAENPDLRVSGKLKTNLNKGKK